MRISFGAARPANARGELIRSCTVRSWRRRIRLCGRFPYRPTIGGACGMYRPPIGPVSAIERAIVCMRMPGLANLGQPISRGVLHTATSGGAPAFFTRAAQGMKNDHVALVGVAGFEPAPPLARTRWDCCALRKGRPDSGGGFGLAAKPLVCGSDSTLAVATFEPAHHEVRTRHLLEVVNEGVVHRCTTERADDRHGLRCELLRHYHAKAGRYLRNEPDQDRGAFRQHAAFGAEARGLPYRLGEQP